MMGKRVVSTSTKVTQPKCKYCGRYLSSRKKVSNSRSYCTVCSAERKAMAMHTLSTGPLTQSQTCGRYVMRISCV